MIWWNIFEFLVTLSAICFLITQDLRLFLEKKVDYFNTLVLNITHHFCLFLCFCTHFSLSFTFLTYETFLSINNNVFIPRKILKAIKKAVHVYEWQASIKGNCMGCLCPLLLKPIYFSQLLQFGFNIHFAGKSKICTCNLRFHPSWCYRKIND